MSFTSYVEGWARYCEQFAEEMAINLYYRCITMPAQLASYNVGGEEIKALISIAEKELGDKFDIREFHKRILENGAIPLIALRTVINQWIEEKN